MNLSAIGFYTVQYSPVLYNSRGQSRTTLGDSGSTVSETSKSSPDTVVISSDAKSAAADKSSNSGTAESNSNQKLTDEEKQIVQKLKVTDAKVHAHELAHISAGGPYAGAVSYQYQTGPDGKQYAVGGEVPIDTSKEKNPEQTLIKASIVLRAALAPADPSSADMAVAAKAQQLQQEARQEIVQQQKENQRSAAADSPQFGSSQSNRKTINLFA